MGVRPPDKAGNAHTVKMRHEPDGESQGWQAEAIGELPPRDYAADSNFARQGAFEAEAGKCPVHGSKLTTGFCRRCPDRPPPPCRGWAPLRRALAVKPDLTLRAGWPSWPSAAHRRPTGRCGVSSSTRGSRLKKARTPASRIAPTSPAAGPGGTRIRARLTTGAWCLSMRPGPRPT
jgi:hypothetical protein